MRVSQIQNRKDFPNFARPSPLQAHPSIGKDSVRPVGLVHRAPPELALAGAVAFKVMLPNGHHSVFEFLAAGGDFGMNAGKTHLHFEAKLFDTPVEAIRLPALFCLAYKYALQLRYDHVVQEGKDLGKHVRHVAILGRGF